MKTFASLALTVVLLLLTACFAARANFTPSGAATFPAKPPGCSIELYSTPPQRAYVELGTFDIQERDGRVREASHVRTLVGPKACEIGADAVIAAANGQGIYMIAVALRWQESAAPVTTPPPAP